MNSLNVVFTAQNQVELLCQPVKDPGPGEICIEATCSLISTGTELTVLTGKFAAGTAWENAAKYPVSPGYSLVGKVVSVGKNASKFSGGQRVVARAFHQQFAVVKEERCYPVPDSVGDDEAAWATVGAIAQNGVRRASVELAETVVVVGLGLLGQLAVQYARIAGAGAVIAVDPARGRLQMAASHGASHIVSTPAQDAVNKIVEISGGAMADVVIDVTGHPAAFSGALSLLCRRGRLVLLGDAGDPSRQCLTHDFLMRDLQRIPAHYMSVPEISTPCAMWNRGAYCSVKIGTRQLS